MKISEQKLRKMIREQHQNYDYDDPLGGSGRDYEDDERDSVSPDDVIELRYALRTAIDGPRMSLGINVGAFAYALEREGFSTHDIADAFNDYDPSSSDLPAVS